MWVGGAGVTLVILLLSTTSNNLSFNTNIYHFLRNLNSTKPLCPPSKGKELCRKTADVENINVPPESQMSKDGIGCKDVGNETPAKELARQEAREETLAKGFSAWWKLQMERKVLVASVCARFHTIKCRTLKS